LLVDKRENNPQADQSFVMKYSKFGDKFTRQSGIGQLMQDLGQANASNHPDLCMLGGGNPAGIPAAQSLFQSEMEHLIESGVFQSMLGLYDGPSGEQAFRIALSNFLNDEFGWAITPDNISLTNGSQNSFFYLFNILAGDMTDGSRKRILFPLAPEYVGYADAGLAVDMFRSFRPRIELLEQQQFKYRVDFDNLEISDDIAAICLSRPTNPTGNVVSDNELKKLKTLAEKHDIPLIIDNAYGQPFPNVIHTNTSLHWDENTILCMSLSKLGLPGARTGIVIANQQITQALGALSGIITLAPNSVGAALMTRLIDTGDIKYLTQDIIKPHYDQCLAAGLSLFEQEFADLPVRLHKPEGAFFLWLWIDDMAISSQELYQRLKARNVYVIPGEEFFIDIDPNWRHTKECIRINYAQPQKTLQRGFEVIADEIRKAL